VRASGVFGFSGGKWEMENDLESESINTIL
jgi:hypothetical protein